MNIHALLHLHSDLKAEGGFSWQEIQVILLPPFLSLDLMQNFILHYDRASERGLVHAGSWILMLSRWSLFVSLLSMFVAPNYHVDVNSEVVHVLSLPILISIK